MLKLIVPSMCRECNIDLINDDGSPADELMYHYNRFHNKLSNRCRKCMQKLYSGYHFKDRNIDKRTCIILPVHS